MRIILACAAGMSTSLLAGNIARLARERGLAIAVEALSVSALDEAQWRGADVVLVGPQMRHLLDSLIKTGARYGVPVAAIPPRDYAVADAQIVAHLLRLHGQPRRAALGPQRRHRAQLFDNAGKHALSVVVVAGGCQVEFRGLLPKCRGKLLEREDNLPAFR